ncbi:MAG TPA: hypothetical protein VJ302_10775, partial [Blastocatellia bacterium]|nr:hypothetical protein [Blastocatellia bacterium]
PDLDLLGSGNFGIGNNFNAPQGRDVRRFNILDHLTWQRGSHRLRFGTELERQNGTGFWAFCAPGCVALFSPESLAGQLPASAIAGYFPTLPSTIRTREDLLNLPFAGGLMGLGDPSQPPPYNLDQVKTTNRYRFFAQDTWKVRPSFTLNYGLSWNYDSKLVNRDLDKPPYLAPLYGSDLSPTGDNRHNFSPALGFAWSVGRDNKTVVRGGAGIYWESELLYRRLGERALIGPAGNGRVQVPSSSFVNLFPGIVNFGAIDPATGLPQSVPVGANLPSGTITNLTLGQFMQIYDSQIGLFQQALSQADLTDLSVRGIQLNKAGQQLYPREYPNQRSYQMSIGFQRELRHDMVLSVDYVRRVFVNTLLGAIDYNRYNRRINGVQSPVIPLCTAAQVPDPNAQCSNGAITFWTPGGRAVYNGLLVKFDKRFTKRYQFTASYALTARSGITTHDTETGETEATITDSTVVNLNDWFQSYGPQGPRHILNLAALIELPKGFQIGINSSSMSRSPVTPMVVGVDLDGDGTAIEPIPGVGYNCFNRGCGKRELQTAVINWNRNFYPNGPPQQPGDFVTDPRGQNIPYLALPSSYQFGDGFHSQDVRVAKKFTWKERYNFSVFAEVFNVFNIANLSEFNFNLNSANSFGQPTQRAQQVFGSGGPRAVQIGARFSF